jgi:hypothetical protein
VWRTLVPCLGESAVRPRVCRIGDGDKDRDMLWRTTLVPLLGKGARRTGEDLLVPLDLGEDPCWSPPPLPPSAGVRPQRLLLLFLADLDLRQVHRSRRSIDRSLFIGLGAKCLHSSACEVHGVYLFPKVQGVHGDRTRAARTAGCADLLA